MLLTKYDFVFLHFIICRCQRQGIPISLMYGREDPWVRPIWGIKVKQQVPESPYYEISPAGHCPHDEVPEVKHSLCLEIKLVIFSLYQIVDSSFCSRAFCFGWILWLVGCVCLRKVMFSEYHPC